MILVKPLPKWSSLDESKLSSTTLKYCSQCIFRSNRLIMMVAKIWDGVPPTSVIRDNTKRPFSPEPLAHSTWTTEYQSTREEIKTKRHSVSRTGAEVESSVARRVSTIYVEVQL